MRFRGAHSPYMPALALFVKDVFDAEGLSELYVADLVTLMYASNFYAADVHRSAAHQQVTRTFQNGVEISNEGVLTLRDEGAKGIYQKSKKIVLEEGTLETVEGSAPLVAPSTEPRQERPRYQPTTEATRQAVGAPREVRLSAGVARPLERPRLAPRQSPAARMAVEPLQAQPASPVESRLSDLAARVEASATRAESAAAIAQGLKNLASDMDMRATTERQACYSRIGALERLVEFDDLEPSDRKKAVARRLDRIEADLVEFMLACAWLFRAANVEPPDAIKVIMARRDVHL